MDNKACVQIPSTHKSFLDILRIIAACSVVLFHTIGISTSSDPNAPAAWSEILNAFALGLKWHVPVFFIITGYLWLNNQKVCHYDQVSRNIFRFLAVLFTLGFFYAMLERTFELKTVSLNVLLLSVTDVLTGTLWDHMYLYSIIGVYLLLPVIKPFFDSQSVKAILIFVVLLFGFTILAPCVSECSGYTVPITYPITTPMFYVCVGGLFSKTKISHKTAFAMIPTAACACVLLFTKTASAFSEVWIAVAAVSIFIAAAGFGKAYTASKIVLHLSKLTFGVYLLHPLFLNLMVKALHIYPMQWFPPLSVLLTTVIIFLLSSSTVYLLRKIPFVRKYIL